MKITLLFLLIGTILSLSATGSIQWPTWTTRLGRSA
jgi:hypothetical protein